MEQVLSFPVQSTVHANRAQRAVFVARIAAKCLRSSIKVIGSGSCLYSRSGYRFQWGKLLMFMSHEFLS